MQVRLYISDKGHLAWITFMLNVVGMLRKHHCITWLHDVRVVSMALRTLGDWFGSIVAPPIAECVYEMEMCVVVRASWNGCVRCFEVWGRCLAMGEELRGNANVEIYLSLQNCWKSKLSRQYIEWEIASAKMAQKLLNRLFYQMKNSIVCVCCFTICAVTTQHATRKIWE